MNEFTAWFWLMGKPEGWYVHLIYHYPHTPYSGWRQILVKDNIEITSGILTIG